MTPCPMCGHDVEWTDHERGVLINAVASSGARVVALEAAYASAPGERKIELMKLVDQEKIALRALKERQETCERAMGGAVVAVRRRVQE